MAEPRPIFDALVDAEREFALGSERGTVVACAALAESILRRALETRLASVADESRSRVKIGGEPGLGELLGWTRHAEQLAGTIVVTNEQRDALNAFNRDVRIPVVHPKRGAKASVDIVKVRDLLRRTLVPLAEGIGELLPGEAKAARVVARRPHGDTPVELQLDRTAQKTMLRGLADEQALRPLLLVLVDGERGQGHRAMIDLVRDEMKRHVRADWHVVGPAGITWPRYEHAGSRLAALLEALGRALGVEVESHTLPDPLAEAAAWRATEDAIRNEILARHARYDAVLTRHVVMPRRGDEVVVGAYLDRIWAPAAGEADERSGQASLALSFETERSTPGLFLMPAWWESWAERRSVRRIRAQAMRAGPRLAAIALPELAPVPRAELVTFLEKRGLQAAEAQTRASELLRRTRGGYFEELVKVIELEIPAVRKERE